MLVILFAKYSLDSISLKIQVTANAPLVRVKLNVRVTDVHYGNPVPDSYSHNSCLCERSLNAADADTASTCCAIQTRHR